MVLRKDYPYILLAVILSILVAMAVSNPSESIGTFALIGLVGIGAVMGIVIKPSLGAYILIVAVFSNVSSIFTDNGLPGIIKPLVAVIFVAIIVRNYHVGQIPMDRPMTRLIEISLIAYFMAVAASYLVATDRDQAFDRIIDVGKDIVIIYCVLFCIRKPEEWKLAALAMVLVTAGVSLLGVYQVATGNTGNDFWGFAGVIDDRLGGPINEPNMWGQVLVGVIPFVIFGFLRETANKKMFYGIVFVILAIVLLNTYSRGAYLAFIISVFFITFFFARSNIWAVSLVTAIVLLALPLLPSRYVERFQTLSFLSTSDQSGIYQDASLQGRTSEMLTALTMFAEHPLLGVGAANYPTNYQKYTQIIGLEFRSYEREAHSLYLEILAETGLFGTLSFMGIVFFVFHMLARIKSQIRNTKYFYEWSNYISAAQVSFVAYLFAAIFLHGSYIRFFWIFIALSLALTQILYEMINNQNYSNRWSK
ncbi:MAG: O-antigen ligase family protein [Anaerolineales bacterium]|nr:MAG: O-antigen ligase family protein [Anaerolineales bacterium]